MTEPLTREVRDMLRRRAEEPHVTPDGGWVDGYDHQLLALLDAVDADDDLRKRYDLVVSAKSAEFERNGAFLAHTRAQRDAARAEVERLTADNIELGQLVSRVKGISGQLEAARAEVDAMKGDLTVQMMQRHEVEDERDGLAAKLAAVEAWLDEHAHFDDLYPGQLRDLRAVLTGDGTDLLRARDARVLREAADEYAAPIPGYPLDMEALGVSGWLEDRADSIANPKEEA